MLRQFAIFFSGQQPYTLIGLSPGTRYFCESYYGYFCPTNGKNQATTNLSGRPIHIDSLILYPVTGAKLKLAMSQRDVGKSAISIGKKASWKHMGYRFWGRYSIPVSKYLQDIRG